MKQLHRINEIANKEKSHYRRSQILKVLRDLEKRMEG